MSTKSDFEKNRDPTGWLVICVAAISLAIIFAIIFYLMYSDINAPVVVQRCNPGLCKFNVTTGIKTCPGVGDTVGVEVTPGLEACSSKSYCNEPDHPCALLSNQTLDCSGVCDIAGCRCVKTPT